MRAKGIGAGSFDAWLGAPPPDGTVPSPLSMTVDPVAVEAEMDLVDLVILIVVTLENWSLLSLSIRLTFQDSHCRYLL